MRFAVESDTASNVTRVTAVPDLYDGFPPLDVVYFGVAVPGLHNDRAALACILLFWRHLSGTASFEKGCSPALAAAIEALLWPRRVRVTSVEQRAEALPPRASQCLVDDGSFRSFWLETQSEGACHSFRLVPEMSGGSALCRKESYLQSSLAFLVAGSDFTSATLARIGAAVLFSQMLDVSELIVPVTRCAPIAVRPRSDHYLQGKDSMLELTARALRCTNLSLLAPLRDRLACQVAAEVSVRACSTTLRRRLGFGLADTEPDEVRWMNLLRMLAEYMQGGCGLQELRAARDDLGPGEWPESAYSRSLGWVDQILGGGPPPEELRELTPQG